MNLGIDAHNNSKILKIEEPQGDEIQGDRIANLFFQSKGNLAAPQDPPPNQFNLPFGAIRCLHSEIFSTKETYEQIVPEEKVPLKELYQHATKTIDFVVVTKGVVTLLVAGERVDLYPGDIVIQRGARHAWHNYGEESAMFVVIMIGADAPHWFHSIETVFPRLNLSQ